MGKRSFLETRFVCFFRIALALTVVMLLMLATSSAYAATFVVNDIGDDPDANHGDGVAQTASGVTSFRAAVEEANDTLGPNTINFDSTLFSTAQTINIGSQLQIWRDTTIQGPGADLVVITGQDQTRILQVDEDVAIAIYDVTLAHGKTGSYEMGGAINMLSGLSLSLERCAFDSNQATVGGGAVFASGITLTIQDCTFSNNAAVGPGGATGGAIYAEMPNALIANCTFEGNRGAAGAAIYADLSGSIEIDSCLITNNVVSSDGSVYSENGTQLLMKGCSLLSNTSNLRGGALSINGPGELVNCTIANNQAKRQGGGLDIDGTLTLIGCTVISNEANSDESGSELGGGIRVTGTLQVGNSIIAGNTDNGTTGQDVYGTVTSLGGNLIGIGDGSTGFTGTGDQVGTTASPIDALLGPLADNGGPTQTCLPLAGSPAINAGLNELVTNPPFDGPPYYDQRGADYLRILGAAVDIGAVEAEVPPDSTPPVITLLGETAMTWECGTAFSDPGATASDDTDGDISANIAVTGTVDITSPGDYVLTYNVSDAAGNAAEPVTRTVTVQDTTPPIITLTGDAAVTMPCNTDYVELGATGSDACDTSLPDVSIDASAVNTDAAGTYPVTYTLTDAAGNVATPVTRTVTVEGPCAVTYHTADQNGDHLIGLTELLRIIQFFNIGGFYCEAGTEDGYAPGATGDTSCAIHQSDYMPQDWKIELSELLRIIQFFNSGGYHACPDADPATEDGYCVGPA